MDISLFDYHLPSELIAQYPLEQRAESRMLILDRDDGAMTDSQFTHFPEALNAGDCLVINDTSVFPARLQGGKRSDTNSSGGAVEIFLVRRIEIDTSETSARHWRALAKPGRRLKEGEAIIFGDDDSRAVTLRHKYNDGSWEVAFADSNTESEIISRFGSAPLPPYIHRDAGAEDILRYQTVFADAEKSGAVAAPTAGLHFTEEILSALTAKGVRVVKITLHVGPGTFKPVQVQQVEEHTVDPEWAEISEETADAINKTKSDGGRVVAVGTTVTRTLEYVAQKTGVVEPFAGMVDLYIRPGFEFRVVDSLLTNFHLPKSSLLILVSALAGSEIAGRDIIMRAYERAIAAQYRFYSYGDCMFIR